MKKISTLVLIISFLFFVHLTKAQCSINLISTNDPLCYGGSNGQISVSMTNSINFNLSPGNINNTSGLFAGLIAGTYTVTVTDNISCTSSTIITITDPPALNFTSASFFSPACFFGSNGSISTSAAGGTGAIIYTISPLGPQSNTTGTFQNLTAQTYTITATDVNGCTSTTSVNLTQPPPFIVTSNVNNQPNCATSCSGTGFVQATGGTPGYTYSMFPNSASVLPNGNISGLCANTNYTIVATDAIGCTVTSVMNVAGLAPLMQYSNVTNTSCGPTACDATASPQAFGTAPFTCNLTDGNLVNITQGLSPFINLCNGTYTLSITDANNCMIDTVFTVISSTYNNAINPNAITSAGSITATPSGGTAPYQYSLNGSPFSATNTFSMLCSGTYTLTIKDSYGAGCMKDTVVTIQAANAFPGVTVTPYIVNPTCSLSNNGMISLVITPANNYTFQWNNNQTTSYLNNVQAGVYSVQILNATNECVELSIPLNSVGANCGNISGNVYYDSTLNCIQEPYEDIIPGTMLVANPGNHITFTDASGNYAYNQLPYGTYTISHQNNISAFQTHCGNNISATLSAANPNQVVDFGDSLKLDFDYSVFLYNMCFVIPNPVKVRNIYYYHNNPGYPSTGEVYAVFDSINHYVSSNPTHTNISGDTVFWNVNNITSNAQWIQVNFTFPTTYTTANTFPFTIGLSNLQYSDTNQLNNQINYTIPFCNSYDPNDKHVAPKGEGPNGNILASDLLLTYNINFQNTGNAPAYNIVIEDTLSDKLDITTFNVLQTSHPYQLEVVNNQIIKWKFYNIMLPDSTTNEPASHGHIHYQIRQKNGNQLGDVIKNKAYIYFDYNPPIITNETINTIYQPTGVKNTAALRNQVVIYPNPASSEVYIDAEREFTQYTIYNQQMSVIESKSFPSTKSKKLNIAALSNGIYFIKTNNGEMKKLVVQK